jgi:hypothetical protein
MFKKKQSHPHWRMALFFLPIKMSKRTIRL